jgi:hypothetical protein
MEGGWGSERVSRGLGVGWRPGLSRHYCRYCLMQVVRRPVGWDAGRQGQEFIKHPEAPPLLSSTLRGRIHLPEIVAT